MNSKTAHRIFVVEDDPFYNKLLEYQLSLNPDFEVKTFVTGRDCLANLHLDPSIITIDYSLPDMNGEDLVKKIKESHPEIQLVIVSGQEDIKTAVQLLKNGAYDYIVKDEDAKERLWITVNNIMKNLSLREEIEQLREQVGQKYDFDRIVGTSDAMKRVFALMTKSARTNITVSIYGETGTGKELVAKAIHFASERKKKPFVAVNVAAIPRELIESELFGHEKGSFTGASARRIGRFEEADKGTIFLDEIAELDLNLQAKLLRVIQEREVTRVGGNTLEKIDVRIISATHKNLLEEVKKGNFREDLYYRLLGLTIELPPLRERGNDILRLAKHFLDEFCKDNRQRKKNLSAEAQNKLLNYQWPGNVRELRAVIELAAVMAEGETINAEDVSFSQSDKIRDILQEEKSLDAYTREIIQHFLDKYNKNVLLVAQKLDIGKSTIYRMIKNRELDA